LQTHWHETFFQGLAVEFWTKAIPAEATLADTGFLEKALELQPGSRVLDVPCGNGRHAIELARRGCRITGVDISEEFLALAIQGSEAAGVIGDWLKSDMRNLPWREEFDAAYCLGNSFGYLDSQGARDFLSALYRALRPGGRLVIDAPTAAESILLTLAEKRWHKVADMFVLSEARYQALESRVDIDYTFIRGGVVETKPTSSYIFTAAELGRLLNEAGFEVVSAFGSVEGEAYRLGSGQLLLVARRT
jgi:SAM-dependent methyltransferase